MGSVEVPYGIRQQTFTDPCCHSTSPAVIDVGGGVLQRGDFFSENLKQDTAISLAVQLGNDGDGNADVATSVNVHCPIPYGTFTEPVESV